MSETNNLDVATAQLDAALSLVKPGNYLCRWLQGGKVIKASIASKPFGDEQTLITFANTYEVMAWVKAFIGRTSGQ